MNTNNTNKTNKESISLNFQDSHLIVNGNENELATAHMMGSKSKREISSKTNNSIKGNGIDRKLTQTNKAIPPTKEEINRLAKAWCELMLNQLQEACNQ